jgi:hypothetical protein
MRLVGARQNVPGVAGLIGWEITVANALGTLAGGGVLVQRLQLRFDFEIVVQFVVTHDHSRDFDCGAFRACPEKNYKIRGKAEKRLFQNH